MLCEKVVSCDMKEVVGEKEEATRNDDESDAESKEDFPQEHYVGWMGDERTFGNLLLVTAIVEKAFGLEKEKGIFTSPWSGMTKPYQPADGSPASFMVDHSWVLGVK